MKLLLPVLFCSIAVAACNTPSPRQNTDSSVPAPAAKRHTQLLAAVDSLAKTIKGRMGVSVTDLATGDSYAYHGNDSFAMFSTYKFPLCLYVLHLAEEGKLNITQEITIPKRAFASYHSGRFIEMHPAADITLPVDSLVWYAMAYSDNITTDRLFQLVGGPGAVNDFIHAKGVTDIAIRNTVLEMGKNNLYRQNWCTPYAMTKLLQLFDKGAIVNDANRRYLLRYMELAPSGAARIKGRLPEGTVVAHKTGTGGTANGITDGVNDVGIITLPDGRRLALSVYINDLSGTVAEGEHIIATVAKMVYEEAVR